MDVVSEYHSTRSLRPLRVLIVDDSLDDAEVIRRTLQQNGLNADCVRVDTPAELKRALMESWDVVACDIRMPRLDAAQVLAMLHAALPLVPVVLVAGTYSQHLWHELGSGMAKRFLSKDRISELPGVIRTLLHLA